MGKFWNLASKPLIPAVPSRDIHGHEILSWTVRFMLGNFQYNVGHIIGSRNPHCIANESSNSTFPSPFKMTAPTPGPEDFSDYFGWIWRVNIHNIEGPTQFTKIFYNSSCVVYIYATHFIFVSVISFRVVQKLIKLTNTLINTYSNRSRQQSEV